MNMITLSLIRKKNDKQVIEILKEFPFKSQWYNKNAFEHAELVLCHMQGKRYVETGDINSFKKINWRLKC